jgi:hypothetical protein
VPLVFIYLLVCPSTREGATTANEIILLNSAIYLCTYQHETWRPTTDHSHPPSSPSPFLFLIISSFSSSCLFSISFSSCVFPSSRHPSLLSLYALCVFFPLFSDYFSSPLLRFSFIFLYLLLFLLVCFIFMRLFLSSFHVIFPSPSTF